MFDKYGSFYFELKFITKRLQYNNGSQIVVSSNTYSYQYQTPLSTINDIIINLINQRQFKVQWTLNHRNPRIIKTFESINIAVDESSILPQNFTVELNLTSTFSCNTSSDCIINSFDNQEIDLFAIHLFRINNSVIDLNFSNETKFESKNVTFQYFPKFEQIIFKKKASSINYNLSYACEISFNSTNSTYENVKSFGYSLINESDVVEKTEMVDVMENRYETGNLNPARTYRLSLWVKSDLFNQTISVNDQVCKTDPSIPIYNPIDSSFNLQPIKKLIDVEKSTNYYRFKQFDFKHNVSNITKYWLYIVSDVNFSQLVGNISSQSYLSQLVDYKDKYCDKFSVVERKDLYCPISINGTKYNQTKRICINRCSNPSDDHFNYELKVGVNYAMFLIYSMNHQTNTIHKRDLLYTIGTGHSAFVSKSDQIYFTSLVYTDIKIEIPKQQKQSFDKWIIGVICSTSLVLILAIAIISLIIYRKRKEENHVEKRAVRRESSNKSGKYPEFIEIPFIEPLDIRISDMEREWLFKHANCDLRFEDEYKNLPDYREIKTCYCAEDKKNDGKNRFLDIKPFDDTRVILDNNIWLNGENNDYINANFIQGYSHKKKFIATQGPLKNTLGDFWHMVWQYRIHAIIMLTNLIEKGMERCAQYWPEHSNIPYRYGDIEVTMRECVKIGDYIKRVFEVKSLSQTNGLTSIVNATGTIKKCSVKDAKMLVVTQYFYPEWPDRDTPTTDAMSVLHLVRDVNKNHPQHQYPIIVHCSAGVGRTGTYITLDAMFEKLNKESKFNAFAFIKQIREQRQYLVQTCKQYVFIHEALYEYCLYGFTDVEAGKLVTHYKQIKEISSGHSKSKLQSEFEKLSTAYSHPSQAKEACSHMNKNRNRDLGIVCYDENRVRLSSLNGSSYINATKILVKAN